MNKLIKILVTSTLLCFACAGAALAGPFVKIDPSGYAGQWSVDYGPAKQGVAWVELGPADPAIGGHVVSLAGAELLFDVSSSGWVFPRESATADGGYKTLTFKTVTIEVDPVHFTGDWRVVAGGTPDLIGVQEVTLVRGLSFYGLEVGATGAFSFHLSDYGTVTVPNELAATGGFRTLTLNNTERFLQ